FANDNVLPRDGVANDSDLAHSLGRLLRWNLIDHIRHAGSVLWVEQLGSNDRLSSTLAVIVLDGTLILLDLRFVDVIVRFDFWNACKLVMRIGFDVAEDIYLADAIALAFVDVEHQDCMSAVGRQLDFARNAAIDVAIRLVELFELDGIVVG